MKATFNPYGPMLNARSWDQLVAEAARQTEARRAARGAAPKPTAKGGAKPKNTATNRNRLRMALAGL